MHLAVGVVVHPASVPFHRALGDSLRAQTDADFTLLVIDDGAGASLAPLIGGVSVEVRASAGGPPAALRKQLIAWAAERADGLIFADADDWCAPGRVAWCRAQLARHVAVVHDLMLVDEDGRELGPFIDGRVSDGVDVRLADLASRNFLGLGNTAVQVGPLRSAAASLPDEVTAFDWALYTRLLADGVTARYGAEPLAAYRQYGKNIARVVEIDAAAVQRAADVKAEHYRLFGGLSAWYVEQGAYFRAIARRFRDDPEFARAYLAHARRVAPARPLWWECAPSDFGMTE